MRLAPSYVPSASIPAIWYYRNESGFLGAHMGTAVERGLNVTVVPSLQSFVLVQLSKKENIFPGWVLLESNDFFVNFDGTVGGLSSVAS